MNSILSLFTQAKSNVAQDNEFDDALNNQDDLKDVKTIEFDEVKEEVNYDKALESSEAESDSSGTEEVSDFEEGKEVKEEVKHD